MIRIIHYIIARYISLQITWRIACHVQTTFLEEHKRHWLCRVYTKLRKYTTTQVVTLTD